VSTTIWPFAPCALLPVISGYLSAARLRALPSQGPCRLAFRALPLATRALPLATRALPLATRALPLATRALPLATRALPLATRALPLATRALRRLPAPLRFLALSTLPFRGARPRRLAPCALRLVAP
jgi:hypothetical protein